MGKGRVLRSKTDGRLGFEKNGKLYMLVVM